MTVYVYRPKHPDCDENGMVPLSIAHESKRQSAPNVISDIMDPIRHHGTGKIIDSKSRFRQDTKASGCVEIGNETIKPRRPIPLDRGERRDAIRRTLYHLRNR